MHQEMPKRLTHIHLMVRSPRTFSCGCYQDVFGTEQELFHDGSPQRDHETRRSRYAGTIADLLEKLRQRPVLREKSPGIFLLKSRAFLHFHDDPAGIFADMKLDDATIPDTA